MNSSIGTPQAEIDIDKHLVRSLLREQHPDLADLPLQLVDAGFDNAMYRLGETYSVRLPRRQTAEMLVEHEQMWLPHLAPRLPIAVPEPVRCGVPGNGYPWKWSVLPWLKGTAADLEEPAPDQAAPLATFLRAVHTLPPSDPPKNDVRGVPLTSRVEAIEERLSRLEQDTNVITEEIRSLWTEALQAPIDVPDTWLHGDMHPRNVLVDKGKITAIIDWGDITSGDAATDLASIWMLLSDPDSRRLALETYGGVTEPTLLRAKGWAILFGVLLFDTGRVDNPRHAAVGQKILERVTNDHDLTL